MKLMPSAKPHEGVAVLAVDPGEDCGLSVFSEGKRGASALINGYDAQAIGVWCRTFLGSCYARGLQGVLVLERPPPVLYGRAGGGKRSIAGAGSVIGCRKLWQAEWKRAGGIARRVVHVYPTTWRAALGIHGRGLRGEFLKTLAMNRVKAEYGITPASSDVCEALLIGKWASNAGEVLAVLPASFRRAA